MNGLSEWFNDLTLPDFARNTLIVFAALVLAVAIHELGHFIAAVAYGCATSITHIGLVTGATTVADTCPSTSIRIIALAGPLFAFVVGLIMYGYERGKMRVLSIFLMFTSSMIQLIPVEPTDGWNAIKFGLPVFTELFVFSVVFAVSANLLIKLVEEKD